MDDPKAVKNILEGALLIAGEPLPAASLARLFEPPLGVDVVHALLVELRAARGGRPTAKPP